MPKVSQSHRDARRTQILDAATICFARTGFHQTTMQDIVRQAELSPGAIYLYFSSKDEIITALADERHRSEQMVIAQAEGDEIQGILGLLAQEFFGKLQRPEEQVRRRLGIQIWAESLLNDRILGLMRRGVDEPRRLLAERVRSAQLRGDLPAQLDPDASARVMIALFHGFILQQAWDEQLSIEPYLATVQVMLQALLRPSPPEKREE